MNRERAMTDEVRRALDERWPRVREAARAHVVVIEEVVQLGTAASTTQRHAACGAAHKLSGNLGMFGRRDASAIASEIEDLLSIDVSLANEPRTLRTLIDRLASALES
jgi:HPt (histidine-containing phosphotransfer) domain-containing protein